MPKVKKPGIIAGHDFCLTDLRVVKAVIESFDYWEVFRGVHWQEASKIAPEQKDWYFPVWCVKL